jgi:hypothetical protein
MTIALIILNTLAICVLFWLIFFAITEARERFRALDLRIEMVSNENLSLLKKLSTTKDDSNVLRSKNGKK